MIRTYIFRYDNASSPVHLGLSVKDRLMDIPSLTKLGVKHIKNHVAQSLYLHSGVKLDIADKFLRLGDAPMQSLLRLLL